MGRHYPAALALIALLIASCGNDDGDDGADTGPPPACPVCAIPQYSCSHTRPIESVFLTITDHSATGCSGTIHSSVVVFDCEKQEVCWPACEPFIFLPSTGGNTVNAVKIGEDITCFQDDVRR